MQKNMKDWEIVIGVVMILALSMIAIIVGSICCSDHGTRNISHSTTFVPSTKWNTGIAIPQRTIYTTMNNNHGVNMHNNPLYHNTTHTIGGNGQKVTTTLSGESVHHGGHNNGSYQYTTPKPSAPYNHHNNGHNNGNSRNVTTTLPRASVHYTTATRNGHATLPRAPGHHGGGFGAPGGGRFGGKH